MVDHVLHELVDGVGVFCVDDGYGVGLVCVDGAVFGVGDFSDEGWCDAKSISGNGAVSGDEV